jgi:hypothetical protein
MLEKLFNSENFGRNYLVLAMLCASLIFWKGLNEPCRGHKPVVVEIEKGFLKSEGYDFDKDGVLDYAKVMADYGRGSFSYEIPKGHLEFIRLNERYLKTFTGKNVWFN